MRLIWNCCKVFRGPRAIKISDPDSLVVNGHQYGWEASATYTRDILASGQVKWVIPNISQDEVDRM